MITATGYGALEAGGQLQPIHFERSEPGPHDVLIQLQWCGVCHSDVHMIDNHWGFSVFPMVPGHEMVGQVVSTGAEVSKFHPGDIAAVGCMIDSCRRCEACQSGLEQYCEQTPTPSFGARERITQNPIYGGFSNYYVVDERFALKIPTALDPARAAPLLCAGITTYSPLRHWKVGKGTRVGVLGVGGLGHLALRMARAMGAEVVAITSTAAKLPDALAFGAHHVIVSEDAELEAHARRLDFILDTVSGEHDVARFLRLLDTDGTLCMLGIPKEPLKIPPLLLETQRRSIAGSVNGGIRETQVMLEFCATHGIAAEVEVVPIQAVNEAFERLKRNDVRYRFVLDMSSLGS